MTWTAEQELEAVKQQLPNGAWTRGASLARCVEDLRMERDALAAELKTLKDNRDAWALLAENAQRELTMLKDRQAWQPIETVPDDIKDNQTPIMLWTPHTMMVGYFGNDKWLVLGTRLVIEATHWQPLPAPPPVKEKEKT